MSFVLCKIYFVQRVLIVSGTNVREGYTRGLGSVVLAFP